MNSSADQTLFERVLGERARILLVRGHELFCASSGELTFLDPVEFQAVATKISQKPAFLSHLAGFDYWMAPVDTRVDLLDGHWLGLREQMGRIDERLFTLAGQALQLARWQREHRFCGRCASPTKPLGGQRSLWCARCDLHFYPRLSPCMIALVTRGDHCLLARHARSKREIFTALAGFVEVGERVEDTVHREIAEEVGLKVKALRYFNSQAWPFPGQLMIGFHVSYDTGEIQVDGDEIQSADWWRYDQLPAIPPPETLSGQLIAHFVAEQHNMRR